MANSSPPTLASMSPCPIILLIFPPVFLSALSPSIWPNVSLYTLKLFMSPNSIAIGNSPLSLLRSNSSSKNRLLYRPVT